MILGECSATNTCTCEENWYGADCSEAICTRCSSEGGKCVAPNVCECKSGWSGDTCSRAKCDQKCENGGFCAAPNMCQCAVPFTGATCEEVRQLSTTCTVAVDYVVLFNGKMIDFERSSSECLTNLIELKHTKISFKTTDTEQHLIGPVDSKTFI